MSARARLITSLDVVPPGDNYADTSLQLWADGSVRKVSYRAAGEGCIGEFGASLTLSPPAHIVDPLEYFAELIAYERLTTELRYKVRTDASYHVCGASVVLPPQAANPNDAPLAAVFTPPPDPRLVDRVDIIASAGRVRTVYVDGCYAEEGRRKSYAYVRDVFTRIHADLLFRSETRQSLVLELRRPRLFDPGLREFRKIQKTLAPLSVETMDFRVVERSRSTGSRMHIVVQSTVALCAEHSWETVRLRVAKGTGSRIVRQWIGEPNERVTVDVSTWLKFSTALHPLFEFSWKRNAPHACAVIIALAPLRLPTYVVLWILQWMPQFGTQRELRLLRLIESATRRLSELAEQRRASSE